MPSASAAAAMWMRRRGLTGCAIETCATRPLPKNELSRLWVRSTNWSISTNEPGGSSSLNDPQSDRPRPREPRPPPTFFSSCFFFLLFFYVGGGEAMPLVVARQEHHRQAG